MLELKKKLKLLRIAFGLVIAYLIMGVYQERILRQPYVIEQHKIFYNVSHNLIANCTQQDTNSTLEIFCTNRTEEKRSERFTFTFSYVGVQCFTYAIVSKGAIVAYQHEANVTPQKYFLLPAIFYVLATVASNMALLWVPYTTQVVAKSSKPIAVMFMSVLIARKSYRPQKYIFVIVIVLALILFTCKDKYDKKEGEDPLRGTALIGVSLFMDGMMAALQERMRSVSKPTSLNLMYYQNAWSSLYLSILLAFSGEAVELVNFCTRHPIVIFHLAILTTVGSVGQFLIARMISNFGALPLSIVMTIRKFITVFLSVIIYDNKLSVQKWIATAIIFLALIFDSTYQLRFSTTSSSSSINSEPSTEIQSENSEENELNIERKESNLINVCIDKEFNDILNAKDIEYENQENGSCEKCFEKLND